MVFCGMIKALIYNGEEGGETWYKFKPPVENPTLAGPITFSGYSQPPPQLIRAHRLTVVLLSGIHYSPSSSAPKIPLDRAYEILEADRLLLVTCCLIAAEHIAQVFQSQSADCSVEGSTSTARLLGSYSRNVDTSRPGEAPLRSHSLSDSDGGSKLLG